MDSYPQPGISTNANVYLSIPYSHPDDAIMEARHATANRVAWHIMQHGRTVFSPISHSHTIEKQVGQRRGHDFWMNQDLPYLEGWADVMVLVTAVGWRESEGVASEIKKAEESDVPVLSFDPLPLLDLVGVSGKKRAGKDTLGDVFAEYGYEKYALADPIKDIGENTFILSREQMDGDRKEDVDPFWGMSPREIMQRIGTDAFREEFDGDIWVDSLKQRLRLELPQRAVVTDVRFPNEVEGIQEIGADVIRIDASERLDHNDSHPSETALDDYEGYDRVIENNGSLDAFVDFTESLVDNVYT